MDLFRTLMAISIFSLISCNHSQKDTADNHTVHETVKSRSTAAIVFTVDGQTRTIAADEREMDTINFNDHPIKTLFRKKYQKNGKPQFEINLNFYEKDILGKIPATYTLPQDHPGNAVKIDLNFYDFERKVEKSLHRRLVFDQGTITIHELGKDKIRFDFKGEVYELMNNENRSPVSGSVNVNY